MEWVSLPRLFTRTAFSNRKGNWCCGRLGVRLIVEPLEDDCDRGDRREALRRLFAGIEGMRFVSRERLPSRDELHDRP